MNFDYFLTYLLSFLLTFLLPRPWLFAEIMNDKELLPSLCPIPTPHLWEGALLRAQERRTGDAVAARAGAGRGISRGLKEVGHLAYTPGKYNRRNIWKQE